MSYCENCVNCERLDKELEATNARLREAFAPERMADSLFEHIKHGDDKHQQWLKDESLIWVKKYVEAFSIPPCVGSKK